MDSPLLLKLVIQLLIIYLAAVQYSCLGCFWHSNKTNYLSMLKMLLLFSTCVCSILYGSGSSNRAYKRIDVVGKGPLTSHAASYHKFFINKKFWSNDITIDKSVRANYTAIGCAIRCSKVGKSSKACLMQEIDIILNLG